MSDAPETAQSFNAKGPTITSFETIDEGPRAFGVKVHSNDVCGVYGESMEFPPAVGVRESAVPPRTGVFGRGDGIGVEGLGDSVGVRGDTTGSPDTSGIGVLGHSGANRAGVFHGNTDDPDKDFLDTLNHSEKHPGKPAQLRLVPYPGRVNLGGGNFTDQKLPVSGLAGDFFVVMRQMDVHEAIIWFCVKSRDENISGESAPGDPAIWVLIGFNPDIKPRTGGSSALP